MGVLSKKNVRTKPLSGSRDAKIAPAPECGSDTTPASSPDATLQTGEPRVELPGQAGRSDLLDAFAFRGDRPPAAEDAWMSTVGRFDNDPAMKEILEASGAVRDAKRTG